MLCAGEVSRRSSERRRLGGGSRLAAVGLHRWISMRACCVFLPILFSVCQRKVRVEACF
jgi:hypothetical protein